MTAPLCFLDGRVTLHPGDCRDALAGIPDCSIDSVASDPPYALVSIVKRFGGANAAATKDGDVYARSSAGFMGKAWDTGEVAFSAAFWAEILRVLKPGGHVVAMAGTRTYHRLACAIEDAGFEIRDQLAWCYGTGFPKSHDVAKGIDKAAGAERVLTPTGRPVKRMIPGADQHKAGWEKTDGRLYVPSVGAPATEEAARFEGWGTALKPAWEPIVLARKPLIGTVAENVLRFGTGAINVDGCRIGMSAADKAYIAERVSGFNATQSIGGSGILGGGKVMDRAAAYDGSKGRWPANIVHDGSDEVLVAFGDTSPSRIGKPRGAAAGDGWGMTQTGAEYSDAGSAARFFYSAKADADDRLGSKHPTVKPVDLMRWLCRLITPPGGIVLDPFAGTGTTGEAAFREGFSAVLIEREPDYQVDVARRMALCLAGPATRRAASAKARGRAEAAAPLFDLGEAG